MPFLRATIPIQTQGLAPSAWAVVLKLAVGAATLLEYHAVSGATAIVVPYVVNGTNGKAILRQLGTSGQTAHSWSTTTAPLGSASFPLVPGVTLSSGGLIKGTPTQAVTNTFAITAWEFAGNQGRNTTATFTFNIATGTGVIGPAIVTGLQNKVVAQGTNVTLTITASGSPPLVYQWQIGGVVISNAITNSLALSNVTTANAGFYSVIVTNSAGAVTNSGRLTVIAPPLITVPMQNAIAVAGGSATFAPGIGGGSATYVWLLNNTLLPSATSLPLTLSNLDPSQSGTYTLVLSNIAGIASNSAQLLVVSPASASNAPQLKTFSLTGSPQSISFNTLAGYTYQIQFTSDLGTNWTTLTNVPATFSSGQVSLPVTLTSSNGFYRVLMSN